MPGNVQRIHRMLCAYLSLGNRSFPADGAMVVTNVEFPLLVEANLIHSVRLDESQPTDAALAELTSLVEAAGSRRPHIVIDPDTRPEGLGHHLETEGFRPRRWVGAAYSSAPQGEGHQRVEVRGIAEKSAWGQFSELRRDILASEGYAGEELDQLAALVRRRSLSSNVRYYLALLDFEPVGHIGLLSIGRSGMLVDLAVRPDRRRSGLARTLIRRMVEQSRNLGHDLSCVVHDDRKELKELFDKAGFEPVASFTSWIAEPGRRAPAPREDAGD